MSATRQPLDEALYRLLFDYGYRESFLRDDRAALGLADDDLRQLDAIDREELVKTAERIVADVLRGEIEGNGGLRAAYPGVFEALAEADLAAPETVREFVASAKFERYRELPFAGRGTCIEEAFFRFLREDAAFAGAAEENLLLLTHEFLTAMMSLLAVTPEPSFEVATTEAIRHNGCAWYATQRYPAPIAASLTGNGGRAGGADTLVLYAASAHRSVVSGAIDEPALQVIRDGNGEGPLAARLAQLGLIAT